jgi:hypothetical protein
MNIQEAIDEKVGEVHTDALDISFGEIMSLLAQKELQIQPDFQRLFRWTPEQQSRLIESVLLDLPIPQIFVIQNDDGVLELIDGLQRIGSMIHFIDYTLFDVARATLTEEDEELTLPLDNDDFELDPALESAVDISGALKLVGCDVVPSLDGLTFNDLPTLTRLNLKRSTVRMIAITRKSSPALRYTMFKRLNTGGCLLSAQEIRNCTSRMVGEHGVRFYKFLKELAVFPAFRTCVKPMADETKAQKGNEELVLRFLAMKNSLQKFAGSVRDWLDDYMDEVMLSRVPFDFDDEKRTFERLFTYIAATLGEGAFVRYKDQMPVGGLKPAYFEAVSMGLLTHLDHLDNVDSERVKQTIIDLVQGTEFRACTGPGANSRPKLIGRISIIADGIEGLL